jgi:tRNA A-37 threonylcarbamoyl transferase component Bud32
MSPLGLHAGGITIDGTVHVAPQAAGQPYVVLGEQWAWKAYRISELELVGTLERVRREGEVALAVAGIDGVIGASRVDEVDGWLVLQMPCMSGTLADHLDKRERRAEPALPAEQYAKLIAGVGETLRSLHRRGIVHRDVKPANLLFDADASRLYVSDFSIVRTRRSDLTRTGTALGTDSYIAPELWRTGESTPASDQYSLGIVAREVFTGRDAAALPGPLATVLRTATAVDPEDRYPGVDGCREFSGALIRAVASEAPRTLADRLRDAPPATRFVWAPGLLAIVGYWVKLIADRNPDVLIGLETLLLPILAGFVAYTCLRLINLPRSRRTRSGAKILDLWWPPWIIVAAALYLGRGIHGAATWFIVIAIPLAFAFAGSYPARCGFWLPTLIERGSRALSDNAWLRPLRSVPAQLTTAGLLLAVTAFIPAWAARAFPAPYEGPTGLNSGALEAVAAYTAALTRNDIAEACAMMDSAVKTSSPCARWTQAQELLVRQSQTRAHNRAGKQPIFDQVPLKDIELVRLGLDASGRTVYSLAYSGGAPSETIRAFGDLLVKNGTASVVITEGPAVTPREVEKQAAWYYELDQQSTFWRMHFTNVCAAPAQVVENAPAGHCLSAMRISPAAIAKLLSQPRP